MSAAAPWHAEAERAVISACMMDEEAFTIADAILKGEHFHKPAHRHIWQAFANLRGNGEVVSDPLILAAELKRMGVLAEAGGKDYIGVHLIDAVVTSSNVAHHAAIVREHADRRNLIRLADTIATDARAGEKRAKEIATDAGATLVDVAAFSRQKFVPVGDLIWPVLQDIEDRANGKAAAGIGTGYDAIDDKIGGFRAGDLVICAGIPGSGKTALGLNILLNVALAGTECAMVSAEMTAKGLTERCLSNLGGVDSHTLRTGRLDGGDYSRLTIAAGKLAKVPLYIDDTARPEIGEVVSRLRYLKTKHPGLRLVVVDFIQLVRSTGEDNMALALTNISYDLKGVAKELELAVIATCQVDAAAVDKSGGRPELYHLRWSQGMREAADFVLMVHRPAMEHTLIRLYADKARDLATFDATLRWVGRFMRVENMDAPGIARAA